MYSIVSSLACEYLCIVVIIMDNVLHEYFILNMTGLIMLL